MLAFYGKYAATTCDMRWKPVHRLVLEERVCNRAVEGLRARVVGFDCEV